MTDDKHIQLAEQVIARMLAPYGATLSNSVQQVLRNAVRTERAERINEQMEAVFHERESCWKAARAGLFKIPTDYEFSRDIVDHYVCGAIRARSAA